MEVNGSALASRISYIKHRLLCEFLIFKDGMKKQRPYLIYPYKGRNILFLYTTYEAFIIHEVFHKEAYKKLNVNGMEVIDIGASVGDTAIYFMLNGAKNVIAYETSKERCALALQNIALNHLEGAITILNQEYKPSRSDAGKVFKIDCDGYEYGLLPLLRQAKPKEIIMEYHQGSGAILSLLAAEYQIETIERNSKERGMLLLRRNR